MSKIVFEYGAMSSRFSIDADDKLIAYACMVYHYDSSAHLIALYVPENIVKNDSWICITGQISDRLDEIYVESSGKTFDEYCDANRDSIREAFKTIKRIL